MRKYEVHYTLVFSAVAVVEVEGDLSYATAEDMFIGMGVERSLAVSDDLETRTVTIKNVREIKPFDRALFMALKYAYHGDWQRVSSKAGQHLFELGYIRRADPRNEFSKVQGWTITKEGHEAFLKLSKEIKTP